MITLQNRIHYKITNHNKNKLNNKNNSQSQNNLRKSVAFQGKFYQGIYFNDKEISDAERYLNTSDWEEKIRDRDRSKVNGLKWALSKGDEYQHHVGEVRKLMGILQYEKRKKAEQEKKNMDVQLKKEKQSALDAEQKRLKELKKAEAQSKKEIEAQKWSNRLKEQDNIKKLNLQKLKNQEALINKQLSLLVEKQKQGLGRVQGFEEEKGYLNLYLLGPISMEKKGQPAGQIANSIVVYGIDENVKQSFIQGILEEADCKFKTINFDGNSLDTYKKIMEESKAAKEEFETTGARTLLVVNDFDKLAANPSLNSAPRVIPMLKAFLTSCSQKFGCSILFTANDIDNVDPIVNVDSRISVRINVGSESQASTSNTGSSEQADLTAKKVSLAKDYIEIEPDSAIRVANEILKKEGLSQEKKVTLYKVKGLAYKEKYDNTNDKNLKIRFSNQALTCLDESLLLLNESSNLNTNGISDEKLELYSNICYFIKEQVGLEPDNAIKEANKLLKEKDLNQERKTSLYKFKGLAYKEKYDNTHDETLKKRFSSQALTCLNESLLLLNETKCLNINAANEEKLQLYLDISYLEHKKGNYDSSALNNEKVAELFKRIGDNDNVKKYYNIAADHYNLAGVELYNKSNSYVEAIKKYDKAIRLKLEYNPSDFNNIALFKTNKAKAYEKRGGYWYDVAGNIHKEAGELYEKVGNNFKARESYDEAANDYNRYGVRLSDEKAKYNEAIGMYNKAIELKEKHNPTDYRSLALFKTNKARTYEHMGSYYGDAANAHKKAGEFYEKVGDKFNARKSYDEAANDYNRYGIRSSDEKGEYSEAIGMYNKAIELKEKYNPADYKNLALFNTNKANAYKHLGNIWYDDAGDAHKKAGEFYEKNGDNASAKESYKQAAIDYNNYAVHTEGGRDVAQEYYKKAISLHERYNYTDYENLATFRNNLKKTEGCTIM